MRMKKFSSILLKNIISIIITTLLVGGSAYGFLQVLDINQDYPMVWLAILIGTMTMIFMNLIFKPVHHGRLLSLIFTLVGLSVYVYFYFNDILSGAYRIGNVLEYVFKYYSNPRSRANLTPVVMAEGEEKFIYAVVVLVSVLVISVLLRWHRKWFASVIVLPASVFPLFIGKMISYPVLLVILTGVVCSMVFTFNIKKQQLISMATIIVILFCSIAGSYFICQPQTYEQQHETRMKNKVKVERNIQAIWNNIKFGLEQLRGKDIELESSLRMRSISFKHEVVGEIYISKDSYNQLFKTRDSVYIFTNSDNIYDGGEWKSNTEDKNYKADYIALKNGGSDESKLDFISSINSFDDNFGFSTVKVTCSGHINRNYNTTLYGKTGSTSSSEKDEKYLEVDMFLKNMLFDGNNSSFLKDDNSSSLYKFEKKYNTDIPESLIPMLDDFIATLNLQSNMFDNTDISMDPLYLIKHKMASLYTYSLSPGSVPSGIDPLEYFVNEGHKGYCTHFATLGTLLLRRLGCVARLAKGYKISKDSFKRVGNNGNKEYRAEIKDSDAHSWTEVYHEGLGYSPIDFTPSIRNLVNHQNATEQPIPTPTVVPTATPTTTPTPTQTNRLSIEPTPTTQVKSKANSENGLLNEDVIYRVKRNYTLLNIILTICSILLISAVLFMLWRARLVKNKEKCSQKVLHIFNLDYCGESEYDYATRIRSVVDMEKDDAFELANLVLKEGFSKDGLTPDENARKHMLIEKIYEIGKDNMGKVKKLQLKIYH